MSQGRRFFTIRPIQDTESKLSEVNLPADCQWLFSCHHRIGPLAPECYLEYVWEALNILYENFPGHISLHHSGLP